MENTLCTVGEYKLCQTTINKESSESFSLLLLPVELHSNFIIILHVKDEVLCS